MKKHIYEVLFGISALCFAGDCDDLKVFLAWHVAWLVIMIYCGYKIGEGNV